MRPKTIEKKKLKKGWETHQPSLTRNRPKTSHRVIVKRNPSGRSEEREHKKEM